MRYDLIVIGAGWAGFNAAVTAAKRGLKVCLLESNHLGGTCLNRGCIPTKALLYSAKIYAATKKAGQFGVQVSEPIVNFSAIQERKDKVTAKLRSGMEFMLKGIDFLQSKAEFLSSHTISAGGKTLEADNFIIASGSRPVALEAFPFDGHTVISSDEILRLQEIPKSLLIIGGGVIGCEFATLCAALGSAVTIVEKMPQLLPGEDVQVARKIEQVFKKKRINVFTATDAAGFSAAEYDKVWSV